MMLVSHPHALHHTSVPVEGYTMNSGQGIASHADVLWGSSHVPAPPTSAEPKTIKKFLFHCSQTSAGDHMQINGDLIGAVEVKVSRIETHTCKLGRV